MRKMHWDCNRDRCFNDEKRVKLGYFDDCFPGKIGLGDVDGIVEMKGFCLMVEWKGDGVSVPTGQSIMFQRITKTPLFTVLVIEGSVKDMSVKRYQLWFNSKPQKWMEGDIEEVKNIMRRWASWTQKRH